MKKIFILFVAFCCTASVCYAQPIAIELRENDKFVDIVGIVFYAEDSLELVIFEKIGGLSNEPIAPYASIYKIIEKESARENLFHIKCQNQLGVIASGTLDLTDYIHPKITLVTDRGMIITNISEEGKKFKKKYIPKIYIGR